MVVLTDDDNNPKRNSNGDVILMSGKRFNKLQGIIFKHRQDDGGILRARVIGPVKDRLKSKDGKKDSND